MQRPVQWDTVHIVSPTGDDDINNHPDGTHCFKTITAAKNRAIAGDTILVFPGNYFETDLLKHNISYYFFPGAKVINDVSSTAIKNGTAPTKAIFDDSGQAITCRVFGCGEFETRFGTADFDNDLAIAVPCNLNRRSFLNINNAATDLVVHFHRVTYSGYADGGVQLAYIINCKHCELKGSYLGTLNATPTTEIGIGETNGPLEISDVFGGIWWGEGETYIDIDEFKNGIYSIYPEGTGVSNPTNLWVRSQRIESTIAAPLYCNGSANTDYKIWITADEMIGSGLANTAANIQFNGKLYLDIKKLSSASSAVLNIAAQGATGLQVWMRAQKITVNDDSNAVNFGSGFNNHPVVVFADVLHWEDLGVSSAGGPAMFQVQGTGTKVFLSGGVMTTKQNRTGVLHTSGMTHLRGLRIESNATNDVDNKPVVVSGSGLILDGCTLLAPALADSVFASSAQTVKVYGTTYANKAKNANVTIQAGLGTLVADANVT